MNRWVFTHTFCQRPLICLRWQHINTTSLPEWAVYSYPGSSSCMTKYYLLVTEGGISIPQNMSVLPGYSLHGSGGQKSVLAHLWQMQTLLYDLLSACHSCQAMGLAPCSLIQLFSSSDTTSPTAYPILFCWKWSHRFKNKQRFCTMQEEWKTDSS